MKRLITITTILALAAGVAFGAPNCIKGKLCGGSCIAKTDICHKPTPGAAAAPPASPAPAATPAPAAAAAPAATGKKARCKDAKGHYAKCGTAGATPA